MFGVKLKKFAMSAKPVPPPKICRVIGIPGTAAMRAMRVART
jgi:hypothetical protein